MLKFTNTYDDEDATIFMIQWRRKQTKSEGGGCLDFSEILIT